MPELTAPRLTGGYANDRGERLWWAWIVEEGAPGMDLPTAHTIAHIVGAEPERHPSLRSVGPTDDVRRERRRGGSGRGRAGSGRTWPGFYVVTGKVSHAEVCDLLSDGLRRVLVAGEAPPADSIECLAACHDVPGAQALARRLLDQRAEWSRPEAATSTA